MADLKQTGIENVPLYGVISDADRTYDEDSGVFSGAYMTLYADNDVLGPGKAQREARLSKVWYSAEDVLKLETVGTSARMPDGSDVVAFSGDLMLDSEKTASGRSRACASVDVSSVRPYAGKSFMDGRSFLNRQEICTIRYAENPNQVVLDVDEDGIGFFRMREEHAALPVRESDKQTLESFGAAFGSKTELEGWVQESFSDTTVGVSALDSLQSIHDFAMMQRTGLLDDIAIPTSYRNALCDSMTYSLLGMASDSVLVPLLPTDAEWSDFVYDAVSGGELRDFLCDAQQSSYIPLPNRFYGETTQSYSRVINGVEDTLRMSQDDVATRFLNSVKDTVDIDGLGYVRDKSIGSVYGSEKEWAKTERELRAAVKDGRFDEVGAQMASTLWGMSIMDANSAFHPDDVVEHGRMSGGKVCDLYGGLIADMCEKVMLSDTGFNQDASLRTENMGYVFGDDRAADALSAQEIAQDMRVFPRKWLGVVNRMVDVYEDQVHNPTDGLSLLCPEVSPEYEHVHVMQKDADTEPAKPVRELPRYAYKMDEQTPEESEDFTMQ